MWLEKVIEAKKANVISTKTMAERSRLHLTERTITRILTRETKVPKIDTILDIGATVGLTAQQLFAETDLVPLDRSEVESLKNEVASLTAEIERLQTQVAHLKEINALHDYYNNRKPTE